MSWERVDAASPGVRPDGLGPAVSGLPRLARSFAAAGQGLGFVFRTQLNWRIHLTLAAIAVGVGVRVGLSPLEWAVLGLAIGLVLAMEAMNSAVEALVDGLAGPPSVHTKHAKDAAAAAVLVAAAAAAAVAGALFGPRLGQFL